MNDDDHDARTIHCGNLNPDKVTEELLYELFLQAGPIERVCIPKDNGKNRPYAFVTYKYQVSVPYALSVYSGTKLFNRDLRLNNRHVNKNTNNNQNNNTNQNKSNNQSHSQMAMEPKPILPNAPAAHQFQMQNPFGNSALRSGNSMAFSSSMNQMNNMMPAQLLPQMEFPQDPQLDFQQLLQLSAQMLSSANGLNLNTMVNDNNDGHKHQTKMMHRHENRSHNQNSNYSRARNDRRRERSRSRSRERKNDWIRNRDRKDNKTDRRDRGNNHGNNNRRR